MTLLATARDTRRAAHRRRTAAWLLLGWATFWLTTVFAQLCCPDFAAGKHNAAAPAQQVADRSADHADGAPPNQPDCPAVATPDAVPPPFDLAAADSHDPAPGTPLPSSDAAPRAASLALSLRSHGLPPPHVPLYLRFERFLI